MKLSGGDTNWLYLASWLPEKLYAGLTSHISFRFLQAEDEEKGKYSPVLISSKQEAHDNLLRAESSSIILPERQLRRDTVVGAHEDAARLVHGGNSEAVVVALLTAAATRLDAQDLALDARHGDIEQVVAAASGATSFPAFDLPVPVLGDGDLARDGAGEG